MRCYQCRAQIPEDAKFCPVCGAEQGFSRELIQSACDGDQGAIAELYNRTYNSVYCTVKVLVGSEDTTLDIVQDSYVKGFRSLSQLQEADKFRAWIKRIAHNRAVDYLRKTKPVSLSALTTDEGDPIEFEDDRPEHLPDVVVDQQETARLIQQILNSLSAEQRAAVVMFYYEQRSVKEIAELLDVSENTVKSRLAYARKKIEGEVRALEKQGTKLYSLAPLAFLLLLFRNMEQNTVPNPVVLQQVQQACGTAASAASASAGAASAANTPTAATAPGVVSAATVAAKGVTVKVIAGVAAVVVLGGGAAAGVAVWQQSRTAAASAQSQVTVTEEAAPPQGTAPAAEAEPQAESEAKAAAASEADPAQTAVYQPVLDEYAEAIGQGQDMPGRYPDISELMVSLYYSDGQTEGFYYDFCDLDGNGTAEMLVAYGEQTKRICGVYGAQGQTPYKLIDEYTLGESSQLYIYPNGTMLMVGSGGFDLHTISVYRFAADGTLGEEGTYSYEGAFDQDGELRRLSDGQEKRQDFDWKPIEPRAAESTAQEVLFSGEYMNGNDWNAGVITITPTADAASYTVTLKAFRTSSDREQSTIFEATAYPEEGNLVMTIDGQMVRIVPGGDAVAGFYLEVPDELQQQWGLDPYTLESLYLSLS